MIQQLKSCARGLVWRHIVAGHMFTFINLRLNSFVILVETYVPMGGSSFLFVVSYKQLTDVNRYSWLLGEDALGGCVILVTLITLA